MNALYRELFESWPAWQIVVGHVSREQPATADPQSVFGAACACDRDRLAALLYGHSIGGSLEDATAVLEDLLVMASHGMRPRTPREAGLRAWMLGQDSEAA